MNRRSHTRRLFGDFEIERYYASRVPDLEQTIHGEWRGRCPIHQGDRPSFAVDSYTGNWFCHSECQRGGSIFDLEMILGGTDFRGAKINVLKIVEDK